MSARRNRPTAFDVSFPTEAGGASTSLNEQSQAGPSNLPSAPARSLSGILNRTINKRTLSDARLLPLGVKRQRTGEPESKPEKAIHPGPKVRYSPDNRDLKEKADLLILGEEEHDGADDKPIRMLSDFSIFDPKHGLELISLSLLDVDDDNGRQFEGAGYVSPVFINEEDIGQEDGIDDEEPIKNLQRLRTSAIFRYTIDYAKADDPVYIETQYGWYVLKNPAKIYRRSFFDFYRPRRIAQIVISTAAENPTWTYRDFEEAYIGVFDELLGERLRGSDIQDAIVFIASAIESHEDGEDLLATPLLQHIISRSSLSQLRPSERPQPRPRPITRKDLVGNVDLAVLRPEKQNRTHVTPLIDKLARGLFREHLEVVGPRPKRLDERVLKQQALEARLRLLDMLARTMNDRRKIEFPHAKQLQHRDRVYWGAVIIDDESYCVGDVVLTQAGSYRDRRVPDVPTDLDSLPDDATLPDFFWFARIIYIDQQRKKLHVQWFEHSSQTFLQEIGNPQELFLFKTCDHVDIKLVVGKVKVHRLPAMEAEVGPLDYFYNFVYDEADASFTSVNDLNNSLAESLRPPNNCPACLIFEQQSEDDYGRKIDNGRGVAYRGERYHEHDFAVIQTEDGPAQIGQIMDIRFSSRARQLGSTVLTVRVLGRINDIVDIFPRDVRRHEIKDERHLFFTDEVADVSVADLVHRCSVRHYLSVSDLSKWLAVSPFYFYTKYHFPSLDVNDWDDRTELLPDNIPQCMSCSEEDEKRVKQLEEFMRRRRPLRALDPFGGVGAFGLGMEESGCIKMTHAVEISPSAAETLRRNSPGTLVYNQCSNIVLRYAIKAHEGHNVDIPESLGDGKQLPRQTPAPGEIDCIIAGFPCQPHSRLNMFQKANDRKSHLILNLLSWIDFLRPKFCYMENVRGFLSYNLNTTQAGRYRVEGGIKMGGLKFLVRALLAMGYQVHFSLLQAAHYGTPQSRVRFFLIAALHGHTLPAFPQPTHDFPLHDALELKFPNGISIRPIRTANGLAPCKFVSIDDAIGDLPRFDWKNPRKLELSTRQHLDDIPEGGHRNIPVIACDRSKPCCGPAKTEPYHHRKPLTSFQARCRIRPTADLQHFTRVLKEETVERVVNIPLNPKADYKSLNPYLWEWQFSNPSSAVARDGFRPGLYGRLDKDGWFQTTVTNVEPTAKQSWVLNPYCKRVVTVRELARSQGFPDHFVFYSMHSDVKTMQRQIGNAVPWPVAAALGRELRQTLFRQWQRDQEEAIVVE